ncbi:MAG TPA: hypothetical protein VHB49_13690 [Bradyrhizobium sp.]|nr:hypothetical protein [Bradyrhizobium sp.]
MTDGVGKDREGSNELTRGITISALCCFLVAGAACASILNRNAMPEAGPQQVVASITEKIIANRQAKADKLKVVRLAMASLEPSQPPAVAVPAASIEPSQSAAALRPAERSTEPLRQAYAATEPSDAIDIPREVTAPAAAASEPPPRPKLVERPAPPRPSPVLSDAQIAGIKERLKLSPDQEYYWPSVESALRAVAHRIQANRRADPHATGAAIDPDSPEVQELKSAAMPLLFGMREDQKREVRLLARQIGLEKVAEMI